MKTTSLILLTLLTLGGAGSLRAQITDLATFDGTHGSQPLGGGLILSGNTLYGTASLGGANSDGAVFSLSSSGGTPAVVGSFAGTNGANPNGPLLQNGSTFYGTASSGGTGSPNQDGVVFSVPVTGGTPIALGSFNGTNGQTPQGSLVLSGSTLYGTTTSGGTNNNGVIFSLPVGGGSPTVLFNFNDSGAAGGQPQGGLILSGSTLYGVTSQGASGFGAVFSFPVAGGTPTVLATFDGTHGDGTGGVSGLLLNGSTLYGTTKHGGANGDGVVFSLPVTGVTGAPTILCSFGGANGDDPNGPPLLSGSTLYGVTQFGGPNNDGLIYALPVTGGVPGALSNFNDANGDEPAGGLTLSSDGTKLYGTAQLGGTGNGVVFSVSTGVPEPGSAALLLGGTFGLATVRRRRAVWAKGAGK